MVALGAYLFRSNMSKLDEDIVYAYYQENINATRRFDAKTICAMYDKRFRAVDVSRSPQPAGRVAHDLEPQAGLRSDARLFRNAEKCREGNADRARFQVYDRVGDAFPRPEAGHRQGAGFDADRQ